MRHALSVLLLLPVAALAVPASRPGRAGGSWHTAVTRTLSAARPASIEAAGSESLTRLWTSPDPASSLASPKVMSALAWTLYERFPSGPEELERAIPEPARLAVYAGAFQMIEQDAARRAEKALAGLQGSID